MTRQTFLGLDEPFLPRPVRTEPRVWMRRVGIFAKPGDSLRQLELAPGLNVIWAPDAEPDERLGSRIGHGAGKTLLCRLLRHALGEPDLASPDDAVALRRKFPEGFVAAEVVVDHASWAVRRPFDPKLGSVAVRGGLDELLGSDVEPLPYAEFLDAVRATLGASAISLGTIADPWLAALAWMSRDQERRLGGPLRWRDRAAAPGSKLARVANVERIRAIRSLLRLRGQDDVAAEHEVRDLEVREKHTIRQLADCEREASWASLRLSREGHGDAAELVGQPLHLRAVIEELEAEVTSLDPGAGETEALLLARAKLEEAVRVEAVEHALLEARRETLTERSLAAHERRAERASKRAQTRRERLAKLLEQHAGDQRRTRDAWARARERLSRARDLERQVARRVELGGELGDVQKRLGIARVDRDRAVREHAKQEGRVADVYDFVVRRLAGQETTGRFAVSATELEAGIRLPDGRRGTSPALRVLETLALDMSALVLACEDRADLPGLWIHDSPREADLARSHYDALYRIASWLEDATSAPGFQYVVTTTTSPPKTVAFRAIKLGAATNDELLLRTALRR